MHHAAGVKFREITREDWSCTHDGKSPRRIYQTYLTTEYLWRTPDNLIYGLQRDSRGQRNDSIGNDII